MTDAAWQSMGGILTAVSLIIVAAQGLVTLIKVHRAEGSLHRVETHTDGMVEKIETMAKREGKQEGKEQAEAAAAVNAPPIPLIVAPEAKQEEIVKWVAQGIAQGIVMEKTRRATEGNGPKAPG